MSATPLRFFVLWLLLPGMSTFAQDTPKEIAPTSLKFPGLLAKGERDAGNPLATLVAMREHEERYLESKVFSKIYPEVRLNFEQFLGVADAGIRAMQLPALRRSFEQADTTIFEDMDPRPAVDAICQLADKTTLVIFGEEHHLPQTRSLYESMLKGLWRCGYRYLAAETFTDQVMTDEFRNPDYHSGFYLMDPVYASAVRLAKRMGYQLVAYDTNRHAPDGDSNFRDRKQAENIMQRIFERDPEAKVLVLAGRGHAAENPPADGWKPMASVLKKITRIDPLTIYAPTMSERASRDAEHPLYRFSIDKFRLKQPTIFVSQSTKLPLGSDNFDAYLFWPRVKIRNGRPDWLRTTLGREDVSIPTSLLAGQGLRMVQAFAKGMSASEIPVDQVVVFPEREPPSLVLPEGEFWLRGVDEKGTVRGPITIRRAP